MVNPQNVGPISINKGKKKGKEKERKEQEFRCGGVQEVSTFSFKVVCWKLINILFFSGVRYSTVATNFYGFQCKMAT